LTISIFKDKTIQKLCIKKIGLQTCNKINVQLAKLLEVYVRPSTLSLLTPVRHFKGSYS
jgi:hypothetical protein